jgi:hypothetical protein
LIVIKQKDFGIARANGFILNFHFRHEFFIYIRAGTGKLDVYKKIAYLRREDDKISRHHTV